MVPRSPARVHPKTVITNGRYTRGGDCIAIGNGRRDDQRRAGAIVRFFGIEHRCSGRAAIFTHPGPDLELHNEFCRLTTEPTAFDADPTPDLKWLVQAYQTSCSSYLCWVDAPGLREHGWYEHGHADRVESRHDRLLVTSVGGQALQYTERRTETEQRSGVNAGVVLIDSAISGTAQNVGRAGSAVTLAGATRGMIISQSVIVDDDPFDTPGQTNFIANTSYGAIAVWCPDGHDKSYKGDNGGYGNEQVTIFDTICAIREPNRPVAEFDSYRRLQLIGASFRAAGERTRGVEILGAAPMIDSRSPTERTERLFEALLTDTSRASDYSEQEGRA
jgi:hypothetical protein